MNLVKGTLSLAIAGLLTACGGGSDNSTNSTNNTQAPERQLSLNTIKRDGCGQKSPIANIKVLIHNQSGDVIKEYATDTQGQLQVDWPADAKHVTVAGNDYDYQGNRTLYINTELDVEPGDLGATLFFAYTDETNCNCKQVDFSLQTLIEDAPDSTLYLENNNFQLAPDLSSPQLEWCESYGDMSIQLIAADGATSMAGAFDLTEVSNIEPTLDDFTATGVEVNVDFSNHSARAYSRTGWSNYNDNLGVNQPIFIYPALTSDNYARYHDYSTAQVGNIEAYTYATATVKVNSEGDTIRHLQLREVTTDLTDAIYSLFASISDNQPPYQYDFSNADSNIAFTQISVTGQTDTGRSYWVIKGGVSGEMPDFRLSTDLEAELASLQAEKVHIDVQSYGSKKSLSEWRKLTAARGEMENSYLSPLSDESHFMQFSFYLDR
ncbi:hypothetical protein L2755_08430 [Shewanella abyssi]|uniref:hypothetical protein n=1 Tax=Shewanella abyssi TaxID=311789 RepID=UPI002010C553|nr:hypothetical protein [Shewanella abyssi]MCL1049643.1 hypothetical protein [Shewanella abyssi]